MLDPPLPTLVDADKHTVHCLIDVPSCLNSPFEVLIDPQGSSTNYTRGYVLDDASKAAMVDLAKRVGECDTCTGQGSLAAGFRARMTAEVVALADEATGTPPVISASNIQARQNVDCTQYQDTHVFDTSLGQGLTLNYLVNEDTFSGQVVYEGKSIRSQFAWSARICSIPVSGGK